MQSKRWRLTDSAEIPAEQPDLFEPHEARTLLDQLLSDSSLYTRSADYKELLEFVVRLRNFAPFNAMLLQVQKPGLTYAASARDWYERFRRRPKEGARPLLILWPFAPVALVYDVLDTEGKDLPQDVTCFPAQESINQARVNVFRELMGRKCINCIPVDEGDAKAGAIRILKRPAKPEDHTHYRMLLNRNHLPPVQFVTIAHELGHLFLGHLGPDKVLNVPARTTLGYVQRELQAESVSYLVCARNGVQSKSETYLSRFVSEDVSTDKLDVYQIMRAAGRVEDLLGPRGTHRI